MLLLVEEVWLCVAAIIIHAAALHSNSNSNTATVISSFVVVELARHFSFGKLKNWVCVAFVVNSMYAKGESSRSLWLLQ